MSRILCVYPQDNSTRFLDRIQNHLKEALAEEFHCYKVKPSEDSHNGCLERLRDIVDEEFVLFLGHGRSDRLYGANTHSDYFVSPMFDYENDNFINKDNIDVFRGKKVFCLSCNSADGLGKWAIEQGAKSFIGFGDIPTDNEIIPEIGTKFPILIARFKGEITWIVKTTVSYSIRKKLNFFQMEDTIRLLTNMRMNRIILRHRGLRHRRILADYLYQFKQNMKLFGNGNEPIVG